MGLLTNVDSNKREDDNRQQEYQTRVRPKGTEYQTAATPEDKVDPRILALFSAGSTWTVTYYRQVLGSDDEPSVFSLSRDAVHQQYDKIIDYPIRLTEGFRHEQDTTNRTFTAEASGIITPAFPPNTNDMIVGDAGDGRKGVYTLAYYKRSTAFKASTYEVRITWLGWYNDEYDAAFTRKTNNTYYFDANGWMNGCGPFVNQEQHQTIESLIGTLPLLVETYFDDFFSKKFSTFIVPDQIAPAYDHFLTGFLLAVLSREWTDRLPYVEELNVTANRCIRDSKTVWTALLNRSTYYLETGIQKALLGDMRTMMGRPELRAAGYSGIPYIVYPVEHSSHVDDKYRFVDFTVGAILPFHTGQVRRRVTMKDANGVDVYNRSEYQSGEHPALIKPVTCDSYYVFSSALYDGDNDTKSQLETVALQAIKNQPINEAYVCNLVNSAHKWTNLERFYYHPVLIYVMILFIKGLNRGNA